MRSPGKSSPGQGQTEAEPVSGPAQWVTGAAARLMFDAQLWGACNATQGAAAARVP